MIALLAIGLFWGANWPIMKIGLHDAGPIAFAAMRNGGGAVVLFAVLVMLGRVSRPVGWPGLVALGLLQTTGQVGLSVWALTVGGAGKVAVLVYTMPFWVVLLAWPLLGERIGRAQWLALGCGLAGVIAIVDPRALRGASLASDLLALGSSICWALGSIVAKRLRLAGDLLANTAWQMLFGSIPLIVLAFVIPERAVIWSDAFRWAIGYNVFVATALAWFLWMFALRALPASIASMGLLITPVIGVCIAWLVLAERPGPLEIAGMLLISGSLLIVALVRVPSGRYEASSDSRAAR